MVKDIFINLDNHEYEYSNEEMVIIDKYIQKGIIKKEDGYYKLNSKFAFGEVNILNSDMASLVTNNENQRININVKNLNGAYDQDFVLVQRIFHPRARTTSKVIEILEKNQNAVLVIKQKGMFYTVKDNIVLNIKGINAQEQEVVLVKNDKAVESFGKINDPRIDEKISLYLYNEDFRLEAQEFDIPKGLGEMKNRADLRSLPFCTIDPATAKDHDDAVYYDESNKTLYVAIADVTSFVKEGSKLDKAARKRAFSLYMPHKVLPMLPSALSEDLCSLKENEERFAFVFKMRLDLEKLEVEQSELFEAVIRSKRKFSYGRIDRVLEGKFDKYTEAEKEIFDYIVPLYNDVTSKFRNKRLKTGYDFDTKEYKLKLDFEHRLESVSVESSSPSHSLIEECMLLANIEASKKVNSYAIYRVHEEPTLQKISTLVDEAKSLGINAKLKNDIHDTITKLQRQAYAIGLKDEIDELVIQAQQQASYSSKNLGHFGLGFKSYSHFTSPIRRYSDLILHRILKTGVTPDDIDDICEAVSTQERKIDQLVWDFEDRKYARWAAHNIGSEISGKIVDIEKGIFKSDSKMSGMRIYIDNYKGQNLFTKVKVLIKDADIVTKKIFGSIKY